MFSLSIGIRLLGLVFSVVLFFYYGKKAAANRWLGGFVFTILWYSLFVYAVLHGRSVEWVAVLGGLVSPLFLLMGPCALLYVRTFLHFNAGIKKRDFLHFLPSFISLLGVIPYLLKSWDQKKSLAHTILMGLQNPNKHVFNSFVTPLQFRMLGSFHMLAYMVAIWIVLFLYSKPFRLKNEDFAQNQPQLRWLWIFAILYSSCSMLNADLHLRNLEVFTFTLDFNKNAFVIELTNLVLLLVIVLAVFFPFVLSGFSNFRKLEVDRLNIGNGERGISAAGNSSQAVQNEEKSSLPPLMHSYISEIEARLQVVLEQKGFTEPDFKLSDLAIKTQTPHHHLSQYFSQVQKQGFPEWRNRLRVDYAKSLIDQGLHNDLNMEGLATKVGFTNRSTFSVVFKSLTGVTLSDYIKGNHNS